MGYNELILDELKIMNRYLRTIASHYKEIKRPESERKYLVYIDGQPKQMNKNEYFEYLRTEYQKVLSELAKQNNQNTYIYTSSKNEPIKWDLNNPQCTGGCTGGTSYEGHMVG